nr:hypothetical protein [uncultured Desulfobacter sp.]
MPDRSVTIARAADDMSSNMTSVATAMEEASSGHNVKANADNLSELGDHLAGLMGKFKV